ncbi:MAG TPA: PAS domain S-box protein [Parvularculaceae bacterium]|nr:PAS domain S-box protein [Parvularculaceae bacterium]
MTPSEIIKSAVLESMEHGYVFYNLEGEVAAYNRAACQILGLAPDQLEGKTSYDPGWNTIRENGEVFPPDLHPIMVSLRKGTPCFGVVMGVTTGKGVQRWLLINSDVVKITETGEIIGAVASFSDITQQINQKKYLERSLEESEASARAMTHNAGYVRETLTCLVKDIAKANAGLRVALGAPDNGESAKFAALIEQRTEKLIALLSDRNAA